MPAWMGRKLSDFEPLWEAEQKLIDEMGDGTAVEISNGVPPDNAPPEHRLRASFIRYLALGGCKKCTPPEKGVQIFGAYIEGDGPDEAETKGLDLEGCTLPGDLELFSCKVPELVLLRGANARSLYFNQTHLQNGMSADGLAASRVSLRDVQAQGEVRLLGAKLTGDFDCTNACLTAGESGDALSADRLAASGVFLRDLKAQGEVRLLGANLTGDLSCTNARLTAGESGKALSADGLAASGVFLRDLQAQGEVRLLGAKLTGDLDCTDASLTARDSGFALHADGLTASTVFLPDLQAQGEIRLLGAKLTGDLDCNNARLTAGKSGDALSAERVEVNGTFFLRENAVITGMLSLADANIGTIADDPKSWPQPGNINLDRFRYEAIIDGPTTAKARLAWLALQDPTKFGGDFWPQPYEQLAKVLREMGHLSDARTVMVEKERLQRQAYRDRLERRLRVQREMRDETPVVDGVRLYSDRVITLWWHLHLRMIWDFLLGKIIGYGRRPEIAGLWALGFILIGFVVFQFAAGQNAIKPNAVFVLRSPEWVQCAQGGTFAQDGLSQIDCFLERPEAKSYPKFNAFIYSADTLLPIVSLEMQEFWIPDDRVPYGKGARVYLWFQIMIGWALSLLAVAGFSGLVKSD